MKLRHEAILSLNTRVRRLRYLFKAIELVTDAPVSRALIIQQLVEYGYSRAVYDEIIASTDEPFSGHFFENVSWSFEKNSERLAKRPKSGGNRVAEAYLKLACDLGLLVESEHRVSTSQTSLPIRFLETVETLSPATRIRLRNTYLLAALLKSDRDLLGAFLCALLKETELSTEDIENNWDSWTNVWLDGLIRSASAGGYGNPIELLRYQRNAEDSRTNPKRYSEHVALIRFHWLLDLNLCSGHPSRNPTHFRQSADLGQGFRLWLEKPSDSIIEGDLTAIHFGIASLLGTPALNPNELVDITSVVRKFLEFARGRGMANVRLALVDSVWVSIASVSAKLAEDLAAARNSIDQLLKSEGILVMRAPNRDESYIPTRQ